MEFNLEVPDNQFFIRSLGDEGIQVHLDYYKDPFIISGQRLIPEWNVKKIEDINEETLQFVFDMEPEVILIGTDSTQLFLPPATQMIFFRQQLGFEVMTTDAACRTFNVLATEGRHVVAALLPLTW